MFKKFLSILIILSVIGYFVSHTLYHAGVASTSSLHSDSPHVHHDNHSETIDHHEHPSEADHPHLEGVLYRSLKQNSLENKSFLQTALISKIFLEISPQISFKQSPINPQSSYHFPPYNFRSSALRI